MREPLAICFAALLMASCAEQRASWALTHAEVHAKPPLSASDLQQITRLVSRATPDPIVLINRTYPEKGHERVDVLTASNVSPATAFILEKSDSSWHIISQGGVVE
jgi:hypothetical protein